MQLPRSWCICYFSTSKYKSLSLSITFLFIPYWALRVSWHGLWVTTNSNQFVHCILWFLPRNINTCSARRYQIKSTDLTWLIRSSQVAELQTSALTDNQCFMQIQDPQLWKYISLLCDQSALSFKCQLCQPVNVGEHFPRNQRLANRCQQSETTFNTI